MVKDLSRFFMSEMEIPRRPGNYVVTAELTEPLVLDHASLGRMNFPAGIYFYCGSAHGLGGLGARLDRHLNDKTPKFWHFDYLKGHIHIVEIWWQAEPENRECEAVQVLQELEGARVPVNGFGSSDCRRGCHAHLLGFPPGTDVHAIHRIFQSKHLVSQQWDAQDV